MKRQSIAFPSIGTNLLLGILMLFVFACKSKQQTSDTTPLKFNQAKWLERNEKTFTYRDRMLNDLLASDTLKKLRQPQVLSLLGQPTRSDSAYLFYLVDQTLLGDVFPLHTKTLVIKFNNDSTVQWCKIHQ